MEMRLGRAAPTAPGKQPQSSVPASGAALCGLSKGSSPSHILTPTACASTECPSSPCAKGCLPLYLGDSFACQREG